MRGSISTSTLYFLCCAVVCSVLFLGPLDWCLSVQTYLQSCGQSASSTHFQSNPETVSSVSAVETFSFAVLTCPASQRTPRLEAKPSIHKGWKVLPVFRLFQYLPWLWLSNLWSCFLYHANFQVGSMTCPLPPWRIPISPGWRQCPQDVSILWSWANLGPATLHRLRIRSTGELVALQSHLNCHRTSSQLASIS